MAIKTYLTRREIDGQWYGESICARSWLEAELIAIRAKSQLDGEFVLSIPNFPGAKLVVNMITFFRNFISKKS